MATAIEIYKNALESFKNKDNKTALKELKTLVTDKNTNKKLRVKSYELLAKICVTKNKYDEAIKLYNNAVKHVGKEEWRFPTTGSKLPDGQALRFP